MNISIGNIELQIFLLKLHYEAFFKLVILAVKSWSIGNPWIWGTCISG